MIVLNIIIATPVPEEIFFHKDLKLKDKIKKFNFWGECMSKGVCIIFTRRGWIGVYKLLRKIGGIKEEFFNPHGSGLNKILKIDFCIKENA